MIQRLSKVVLMLASFTADIVIQYLESGVIEIVGNWIFYLAMGENGRRFYEAKVI